MADSMNNFSLVLECIEPDIILRENLKIKDSIKKEEEIHEFINKSKVIFENKAKELVNAKN